MPIDTIAENLGLAQGSVHAVNAPTSQADQLDDRQGSEAGLRKGRHKAAGRSEEMVGK